MKTKILSLSLLLLQSVATACNVPVFRYALERWPVSPYRAVVVKAGDLTKSEKADFDLLERAGDGENGMLNLVLWNPNDEDLKKSGLDKVLPTPPGPTAVVHLLYPVATGEDKPFWSAQLTPDAVKKIRGSAFRNALVKKILEGNSGVFVVLESGDGKKDGKVVQEIEGYIREIAKEMELPPGVVAADGSVTGAAGADAFDPINRLRSAIPLKIAFTTLRMARAADEVLAALLLGVGAERERKIEEGPMVFAVYGRARALTPMIGEDIGIDNIGSIAYYFTGACSCQIKALNPGTDLLIDHDWDSSLFGTEGQ